MRLKKDWECNTPTGGVTLVGAFPLELDWGILKSVLQERGLRRDALNFLSISLHTPKWDASLDDCSAAEVEEGVAKVRKQLRLLRPSVVVAFGNEAAWALVPNSWPTGSSRGRYTFGGPIQDATGVEELRGFVFDSPFVDAPVVVTVAPTFVQKSYTPWRVLLSLDMQRAKEIAKKGMKRPLRRVEVVE